MQRLILSQEEEKEGDDADEKKENFQVFDSLEVREF